MSETLTILVLLGGICGLIGMVISLICVACIVGFLRSTHKVQYVPLKDDIEEKPVIDEESTELEEELKKVGRIKKSGPGKIISEVEQEMADITTSDFLT